MSELIAFIGVGNMGLPMAENLMKSGKKIKVFDVSKKTIEIAKEKKLKFLMSLKKHLILLEKKNLMLLMILMS